MALPDAVIHVGAVPCQVGPARSAEGDLAELDTVELDVLVAASPFSAWRAGASAAGYTRGSGFPGWSGMFVQAMSAEQEGAAHALVTVSGFGLLTAGEKRKRTTSCAGQVIAVGPVEKVIISVSLEERGDDPETPEDESASGTTVKVKRRVPKLDEFGEVEYKVITTPSGLAERWNINQAILNVTDTYFVTSAPATNTAGTAVTPPDAPTPPPYVWSGYAEPLRLNHPAGWVLDDRQVETIVPGQLWRVTDTFAYYYTGQPD